MTITPDDVLAVIGRGKAEGVSVRSLAIKISQAKVASGAPGWASWNDAAQRQVRKAVEALRREGKPICATPEGGYYLAETADELSETIAFLRARAMTSLTQIARLRRVSLPVLMGQLQIELAADVEAAQPDDPRASCVRLRNPDKPLIWPMCKRCAGGPCTEGRSA
jgi:hypothetical protein